MTNIALEYHGFHAGSGRGSTIAKNVDFTTKEKENGNIKLYTKKYSKKGSSDEVGVIRIQFSFKTRDVIYTTAIRERKGSKKYTVVFVEKDPIDPTHGRRHPETAGGCFDCPPNNDPFGVPWPSGEFDPFFWDCVSATLGIAYNCVFSPRFSSCIGSVADRMAHCQ